MPKPAWVGVLILVAAAPLRAQPPRLTVQITGPESAAVGAMATWQIQVNNNGPAPIAAAVLRTELDPGLQHPLGRFIEADVPNLASGATYNAALTARAAQPGRQRIDVTVAAVGLTALAQAIVQVQPAPLELALNGPVQRCLGRTAEVDLDVHNAGQELAEDVRVTAEIPEGLKFAATRPGGAYDPRTRQVSWRLGPLKANERRGLALQLVGQRVGAWTMRTVAVATNVPEAAATAEMRIDGEMPLVLEVSDSDDPVPVGAETTYEIRVRNQGPCASIGLRIQAVVPAGLIAFDADGPTKADIQGTQVSFLPLPKLAPQGEVLYHIRARGTRPGEWRLIVQMSSDQLHIPLTEVESTRVNDE